MWGGVSYEPATPVILKPWVQVSFAVACVSFYRATDRLELLLISLSPTHAHTHTHTHAHTHTFSLSLSLSHTHSHTHALSLTHTLTHSHTHTLSGVIRSGVRVVLPRDRPAGAAPHPDLDRPLPAHRLTVRERESERVCVCGSVCVRERESVCVCARERLLIIPTLTALYQRIVSWQGAPLFPNNDTESPFISKM